MTATAPQPTSALPLTRRGGRRGAAGALPREAAIFAVGITVIAVHVLELNRGYHRAAREPKTLWEIPESKHTGGLTARPEEYQRRVTRFFDRALRP